MQPNQIVLAVDEANDTVLVNHTFDRFDEYQNRTVYASDVSSLSAKDQLTFYRTFPKSNGNFKGVAKSALKFSWDQVVDGVDGVSQLTSPIIMEISFSIPVGSSDEAVLLMRQRGIAILDDDTIMDKLNLQQQI
jgi:hypothetical protein